ncbi:MAG: PEP-CTERM sorting domain-containing protein [Rhodocyclaceae bacterium]|nr:PEP-CTERM sorting domain-containing protein [Rhodocyclaceae bacterium]
MLSPKSLARSAVAIALGFAVAGPASATVFSGTVYYTLYSGGQNVWRIGYTYNDATQSFGLGSPTNITSTNGADGIIFAPNGNLLIGGQGSGNVYEVNPASGALVHLQHTSTDSYHLALDPSGNAVYTSTFMGALQTLSMPIGSGVVTTGISGDEGGITQVAFGNGGSVFYVNGNPNGGGNVGTINLGTGVTSRLYAGVAPAHGLIYDPFTSLMTMFGAGRTGTMSAADGSGLLTSGAVFGVGDFDQGAVDGFGHALVAGSNAITFIDYHLSHDITNPDYTVSVGGFGAIDDLAPLTGPGSNPNPTPEPGILAMLGLGLGGLFTLRRRTSA